MTNKVFSVSNNNERIIITILGLKFKIKSKTLTQELICREAVSKLNDIHNSSLEIKKNTKQLLELNENTKKFLKLNENAKYPTALEKIAVKVHQLGKIPRVKESLDEEINYEAAIKLKNANQEIVERKKCPLCGCEHFLIAKEYEINEMIRSWVKEFNLLPIPNCYKDKILKRQVCMECGIHYYNYFIPDTEEFYEKICEIKNFYGKEKWDYEEGLRIVQQYKPKKILDIGCGYGHFLDKIRFCTNAVMGTEFSSKAIEVCKQKGLNVVSNTLKNIDEKFDLIAGFQLLEHVTNPNEFIEECVNLMNPNGLLLFVSPNADSVLNKFAPRNFELPPNHNLDISKNAYEYIAKKFDLELVEYRQQELEYWLYLLYLKGKYKFLLNSDDKWAYDNFLKEKESLVGQNHLMLYRKK